MKWITRSHVHVDRVACPWLIARFIDSDAEFLFVPKSKVLEIAEREGRFRLIRPGPCSIIGKTCVRSTC
jgi:hypothetical protein